MIEPFYIGGDGTLRVEDVPADILAMEYGTPLYVYNAGYLRRRFDAMKAAFGEQPAIVCYSVKANSNLVILNQLKEYGAGFDIVSGGELFRVLKIGADPQKVVYSGVGKTPAEIEYALKSNILMFNVESFRELETMNNIATSLGLQVRISLRINPDVDPQTHPYISTGLRKNKFGIAVTNALEVYKWALNMTGIEVVGVDFHIGSQLTKLSPIIDAIAKTKGLVEELRTLGADIRYFDIGGGLGITYDDETPPEIERFAAAVAEAVTGLGVTLVIEPGRSIVGNAGILLTKVLYQKTNYGKNFTVVDAAMNDLARPALYDAYHRIMPVNEAAGREKIVADIVGPICESGDFFAKDREIDKLAQGEYLAIMSAGAYGFSMSSNYNSRPRAAEVIVKGEKHFLIRERELYEDLVRGELV